MVGLRAPAEAAEAAKLTYGHALPELVEDQPAVLDGFSGPRGRQISQRLIAEIVHARAAEISAMALKTLKRARLDAQLNGGYVLSGGGSELPGMVELFEQLSGLPTRAAQHGELYGLSEQVADSSSISALGLLHWAAFSGDAPSAADRQVRREPPSFAALAKGVLNLGRVFLPN